METERHATHAPFAVLLKRYRRAVSLTQEALAERAGLSREAISALERGERQTPRKDTVRMLADALGLADAERDSLAAAAVARPHDAPPADSARPPAPTNLPLPPTPLIGREQEAPQACALLRRDDVRLLTLTGPAGVGKSRLSLAVAAELRAAFPDGVFLALLAPLGAPALVATAIAQVLGLREQGSRPLHETLTAYLRGKRLLLLLDNFEHVAAAAPLLADLLAACPTLKLLVTSRAAVHVRGERLLPVPPLALPDLWLAGLPLPAGSGSPARADLPSLDALAKVAAVTLFVQRAQAVQPAFALTCANAPAVAAICRRLDGLPLAIELAAARVTLLPPPALLARLEGASGQTPLHLLVGGAHDLSERQQTLRNALAWSYDLLSASEQALFRRLSVFVGGGALEAVEAVCRTIGDIEGAALEWLAALVDKNLLRREEGIDGEPRVGMLETLREYGREQLAASGEREATERAHADYYLALVEAANPKMWGPEQAAWLSRLETEHDNLRAVLRWALENREGELGLRLAGWLWHFWEMHGYLREGRSWLEALLALDMSHVPAPVRAQALNGAGNLAYLQSDYARARAWHEESLVLRRGIGDKGGIASSLNNLANVASGQNDYAQAQAWYEESLALWQELGDREGIASSLNNLGGVALDQGACARARALYEESLPLWRELGDTWHRAVSLNNLGDALRRQGALEHARAVLEESLALRRELGDTWGIASSLNKLGNLLRQQGHLEQARSLLREGVVLYRKLGGADAAACLETMAQVILVQGEPARAGRLLGAAEALWVTIGAARPPVDHTAYQDMAAAVRAALGEEGFAAEWTAGAAFSLEQAIAEALRDDT